MYSEGNILFFTPFYFKNGSTPAPKFFVVLKVIDGITVLASLPSSKDFIPKNAVVKRGCIELPDININCFVFSNEDIVTCCGKKFDLTTYIYGGQLDSYDVDFLNQQYSIEGIDFEFFGEMKPELFSQLISCLKSSRSVKKRFLKILG